MDKKEWYTIKEIADDLKVTKQAIRKRVDNLDTKLVAKGVDGKTILISAKGVELLRNKATNRVSTDSTNDDTNVNTNVNTNIDTNNADTIKLLQDILDTLKEQLKQKDEQIKELNKALDQEQKLHAMTQQKILELEEKKADVEEETQKKEPKVSIWKKIFNN